MESPNRVALARVRIIRAASFGVFCSVNGSEAEMFVPFAQVYEPSVSLLVPGEVVEMKVPDWFARDHHLI